MHLQLKSGKIPQYFPSKHTPLSRELASAGEGPGVRRIAAVSTSQAGRSHGSYPTSHQWTFVGDAPRVVQGFPHPSRHFPIPSHFFHPSVGWLLLGAEIRVYENIYLLPFIDLLFRIGQLAGRQAKVFTGSGHICFRRGYK